MMAAEQTDGFWLSDLLGRSFQVPGAVDRRISGLALDSRRLDAGECFIAYPGHNLDGNDYIDDAIANGASAVVAEQGGAAAVESRNGVPIVRLPAVREQLSAMAAKFYGDPSTAMNVVGVTGTNGKTTVAWLLAEALAAHRTLGPCGFSGTIGSGRLGQLKSSENTTPDAISLQRLLADLRAHEIATTVLEVSSHALVQHRVEAVAFDLAVLTNLTRDHLDYHQTIGAYRQAKKRLFEFSSLRAAVVNGDDSLGQEIVRECTGAELFIYSLTPPERVVDGASAVYLEQFSVDSAGIRMSIVAGCETVQLHSQMLGRLNVANLLAAFAAMLALGVAAPVAGQLLSKGRSAPGRLQLFGGGDAPKVIVDYAHTPDALRQVLLALRPICDGELWCVFGCGGDRDTGKRALMGEIAEALSDHIIVTNDNPRGEAPESIVEEILNGTENRSSVVVEPDRSAAVAQAISTAAPEDIVLVAGKGHETYQDIGGVRMPMSDQALVKNALSRRAP